MIFVIDCLPFARDNQRPLHVHSTVITPATARDNNYPYHTYCRVAR